MGRGHNETKIRWDQFITIVRMILGSNVEVGQRLVTIFGHIYGVLYDMGTTVIGLLL